MHILAADDDNISRTLLLKILESNGRNRVSLAADGEEAWCLLRDASRRFDAVILDVMMPRIDGFDLLQRIRGTPGLTNLPVILCTGANDRTTVERAVQLSANHFIVKPFTATVVLSKLQAIEAELFASTEVEDSVKVCQRLQIDATTYHLLVDSLLVELQEWLAAIQSAAVSRRFDRVALRANGLKGACANLGLLALGNLLNAAEALLAEESECELRSRFILAEAEVSPLLDRISACATGLRQAFPASA